MTLVLLDTGPIVAILDRSDRDHERCTTTLNELEAQLITCEAVLTEACYLLRGMPGGATDVLRNAERGRYAVPYQAAPRASHLAKLMEKYNDIEMDLADACLVDMAAELRIGRIFTLDGDFKIYRWGRNRPFELIMQP